MSEQLAFLPKAWEDYLYWQTQDKKTLNRINQLLRDIIRNGNNGLGNPEPLRITQLESGAGESMKKIDWYTAFWTIELRFYNAAPIMVTNRSRDRQPLLGSRSLLYACC